MEENARERYEDQGAALQQRYENVQARQKAEKAAWEQAYENWQQQAREAEGRYDTAYERDYNAYKTMLGYFADKAAQEQKASDSGKAQPDAGKKQESLSSAAADSLHRAMRNYLAAGDESAARALAEQYTARMTAAQKRRFAALFEKYGAAM